MMLLSVIEGFIALGAAYLGFYTRFGEWPVNAAYLYASLAFALVLSMAMMSMGVQEARIREGTSGMMLRTAVSIFLLGTAGMGILAYVIPELALGRGVLLFAALEAFLLIMLFRWIVFSIVDENLFKKRIVVLGTGQRALKIAERMRRSSDQRAFFLIGFLDPNNSADNDLIGSAGAHVVRTDLSLPEYCKTYEIQEIVVAMDERRRNQDAQGGLPLEELLECRLSGVDVCDVQQFIERESCKVDIDLLRPSWLVFSDGFIVNTWRAGTKRVFDLFAGLLLFLIAWPVMILTALLIKLESPTSSVLYRQARVGLNGQIFDVLKFRSMDDSDDNAPTWAQSEDPRTTRIGRFIRNTRIDELPQLFNVLRGQMSFVGPRPERPVFVDMLNEQLPFYAERHRIKPGITGWAQLCYPYGASVEDAKEKLQYDLYYLKNHSILLDLVIILQTVEVVLIGEGAR